jgi:hypothetical protein
MLRLIGDEFDFGCQWQARKIAEIIPGEFPSVETVSRQYLAHQLLKSRALVAFKGGSIRK